MSKRSGIWQTVERRLLESGMPKGPEHLSIPQYLALVFARDSDCTVRYISQRVLTAADLRQASPVLERLSGVALLEKPLPRVSNH